MEIVLIIVTLIAWGASIFAADQRGYIRGARTANLMIKEGQNSGNWGADVKAILSGVGTDRSKAIQSLSE